MDIVLMCLAKFNFFLICQYVNILSNLVSEYWHILVSHLWFAFNSGVLLGHLPLSPLCLKLRWMVWSDIDVDWPWSSPLLSLKVVLGFLGTIRIICLLNSSSVLLLRLLPWRLATIWLRLNNMWHWDYRNIKLPGDVFIALTLNMFFHFSF